MKKSLVVLILALLCCIPVYAQKKSKKTSAKTPQPVVVTFVAAGQEEFLLYFDGQRVNKDPQSRVEVRADMAKAGGIYNVRAVVKKPRVGSDMAFATITISSNGEEYVVWANTRYDRADLLSRADYNKERAVSRPRPNVPPMVRSLDPGFKPIKAADADTTLPDNVILIEKK